MIAGGTDNILRCDSSIAGNTKSRKTRTALAVARSLMAVGLGAAMFDLMYHSTNAASKTASTIHVKGGHAISIIASASHAATFRTPMSHL